MHGCYLQDLCNGISLREFILPIIPDLLPGRHYFREHYVKSDIIPFIISQVVMNSRTRPPCTNWSHIAGMHITTQILSTLKFISIHITGRYHIHLHSGKEVSNLHQPNQHFFRNLIWIGIPFFIIVCTGSDQHSYSQCTHCMSYFS